MTFHAWRVPTAAAFATLTLAAQPASVALAAPAPRAAADGADLMSVSVDDERLSVRFRDARQAATGAEGTDPADVTLGPAGGLAAAVPADPAYAFLGEPGQPVWSLSEGGSRFPSLDLTGVDPGEVDGGAVNLRLVSAEGPGDFAMYTVSPWGEPAVLLDGAGRTSTRLPAGERLGGVAWTFDTAGDYRLTFTTSATADGKELADTTTYAVEVPAIASAPAAVPAAPRPTDAAQARAEVAGQARQQAAQRRVQRRVISDGHVDMGPQLTGDTFRIKIKDDASNPPQWLELSDVVLKVSDKAKIDVPAGSGYAFLGKPGDSAWVLPQTQQPGIVWPGWNTQHESIISGVGGAVTWTLKGVTGPGQFGLFLTDSFGAPQVLFDSAKPLPQKLAVPLNTHAHGNWAFTKAGIYQLAVRMDARTRAGKPVTDTRTLSIAVGDATNAEAGFGASGGSTGGGSTGEGTNPGGSNPGGSNAGGSNPGGSPADGKTGTAGEKATSGGALARTGANIAMVIGAGVVLVLVGMAAVRLGRRRNPAP